MSNSGENQCIYVYYKSITDPEDVQISRIVLGFHDFIILRFWPTVRESFEIFPRVSGKTEFFKSTEESNCLEKINLIDIYLGDSAWRQAMEKYSSTRNCSLFSPQNSDFLLVEPCSQVF